MKYKFLDWLRCIGVCLIVYDHLGPLRNPEWFVASQVNSLINAPLGIIQYFGALGVCLFFIISGFCLTTSATAGWQFIYNKVIRILVPLFLSTFLFFCFNKMVSWTIGVTFWDQFSLYEWLTSSTLFCYVLGQDSVINGSTWYLFPLVLLYVLWGLFYRIAKKNPFYFACILNVLFIVVGLVTKSGYYKGNAMQWLVFTMVPVFGILIRAVYNRRISVPVFLSAFAVSYLVFLKNIMIFRPYYYTEEPYLISFVYAILIFGLFLLLEERIIIPKFVSFISNISFSLYLIHMTMGGFLMSVLNANLGFTISFVLTVIIITVLARYHYEWIEKKAVTILKLRDNGPR